MLDTWRRQFTLSNLLLDYEDPIVFIICQWQRERKRNIFYLIYRWIIALTFFITFILSVIDLKHIKAPFNYKIKWLIYLTNWGYTLCTVQSLLAALLLSVSYIRSYLNGLTNYNISSIKIYKIYWLLNTVATDIAFGITILYWGLIYDAKVMSLDAMNIIVHASNSIIMLIDLFIVSHPVQLLHCCYSVTFGICYVIFSVIYYLAGGISKEGHDYIYPILNWNKPGISIVVCIGVTIFIAIVHFLCCLIYKLRLWVYKTVFLNNVTTTSQETNTNQENDPNNSNCNNYLREFT